THTHTHTHTHSHTHTHTHTHTHSSTTQLNNKTTAINCLVLLCVCVCVCVRSKRSSKACWASCLPPFTLTTRRPSLTAAHPLIMGCLPCALSSGPQSTGHQASPWQHQSRAQEGRKSKEKGVCVCMSVCVCRGD